MPNIHLVEFEGPMVEIMQTPTLRCVGKCSAMQRYQVITHAHPCTEAVFVLKGEGSVVIGQERYALGPGMLAVYDAGDAHSETLCARDGDVLFYHIKLEDYALSRLTVNRLLYKGDRPVMDCGEDTPAIRRLLETMFSEAERRALGYRQALDEITAALFVLMLRVLKRYDADIPVADNDSLAFRVQRYIMTHYAQPLTVRSMAEAFHVDVCYLSHAFKKALGLSPYQYLTEFRVNAASRMLKTSRESIRSIAEAVGYQNASAFETQFRKLRGATASAYRSQAEKTPLFRGVEEGYPLD